MRAAPVDGGIIEPSTDFVKMFLMHKIYFLHHFAFFIILYVHFR